MRNLLVIFAIQLQEVRHILHTKRGHKIQKNPISNSLAGAQGAGTHCPDSPVQRSRRT
ncbi:unnamed protein product, partial [Nesidiocoris tenuis]